MSRTWSTGAGRILAVGSTADIRALSGPGTREVELRGRSLLPGFIDAHCHLTGLGMAMVSIDCKAPGMQSIEALQKAVYERAATQPPGTWIRGRGYDQTRLREGRHPHCDDWDAVAPDHPVIFTRTCGHIASVNSQALALAGITDQAPDPLGGALRPRRRPQSRCGLRDGANAAADGGIADRRGVRCRAPMGQ